MTDPTIEEIAGKLTAAHFDFLDRVAHGRRLKLADRAEDRVRQTCRRLGLAEVLPRPRRWNITPFGERVRTYLQEQGNE